VAMAAGAVAVGAGGELCSAAAMATGDWDTITATAQRFTEAAARARQAQA
jgi:2-dehydro-3-deoxyphosphogluconate aldolase/(4S)-4-hydroxy-2-oxoglutarate aldolase